MEISLLIIVVVFLAAGLAVETGIATWSIRRASMYKAKKIIAESQVEDMKRKVEHTTEKFQMLDRYATEISWLLKYLYNRYGKFTDIEKDVKDGIKSIARPEDKVEETNKRYTDLVRAAKLMKVTVRATEKVEDLLSSIAVHINSIIEDLQENDEDDQKEEDMSKMRETSVKKEDNEGWNTPEKQS